jgi:glutamate N-acetyltransferase/amino-acid N-acetyltransferase
MKKINNGGICSPLGFSSAGISIDIKGNKSDKKDLGIILSISPCYCASTFTKNKVSAAPVKDAKKRLFNTETINAIIVNSGNANACTGKQGLDDCETIINHYAKALEIDANSLLISSTGVIGENLPVEKFISNSKNLINSLDDDDNDFAESILTTDTVTKKLAVLVETENGIYVVGGVAKGAGMIAPEMATMLAFITTDAMVDKNILQNSLDNAVKTSFNSITVDGDMSTNDSVFLLANGMSGINIHSEKQINKFKDAVSHVCLELAKMIVKDGEGATKFIQINVKNALTQDDAKKCAFKIANSPLVKTMFAGEDPNWGRLLASAGASLIELDEEKIDIYFNDLKYVESGSLIDKKLEEKVHQIMKTDEYEITIDLNIGNCNSTVYTTDLTKEYISINADYRS